MFDGEISLPKLFGALLVRPSRGGGLLLIQATGIRRGKRMHWRHSQGAWCVSGASDNIIKNGEVLPAIDGLSAMSSFYPLEVDSRESFNPFAGALQPLRPEQEALNFTANNANH